MVDIRCVSGSVLRQRDSKKGGGGPMNVPFGLVSKIEVSELKKV